MVIRIVLIALLHGEVGQVLEAATISESLVGRMSLKVCSCHFLGDEIQEYRLPSLVAMAIVYTKSYTTAVDGFFEVLQSTQRLFLLFLDVDMFDQYARGDRDKVVHQRRR